MGLVPVADLARRGAHGELIEALRSGGDPDGPASDGLTPLSIAALRGDAVGVAILVSFGASVNAASVGGLTPLMCASGHPTGASVVALLPKCGAGVDAASDDGDTALMLAARSGSAEVLTLLLAAGADPSVRDPAGRTALDHARGTYSLHLPHSRSEALFGVRTHSFGWSWGRRGKRRLERALKSRS